MKYKWFSKPLMDLLYDLEWNFICLLDQNLIQMETTESSEIGDFSALFGCPDPGDP